MRKSIRTSIGPPDGSAAEIGDRPICIVAGCSDDPVTHRLMRVSVPVWGKGSDGSDLVVDRREEEVDVAMCSRHAGMLDVPLDHGVQVVIDEASGLIE